MTTDLPPLPMIRANGEPIRWSSSAADKASRCPLEWAHHHGPLRPDPTGDASALNLDQRRGLVVHDAIAAALQAAVADPDVRPGYTMLRYWHQGRVALGKAWDAHGMPASHPEAENVAGMLHYVLSVTPAPDPADVLAIEDERDTVTPAGRPFRYVIDYARHVQFRPRAARRPRVTDWKGLALDTPLPTPGGWTTMGAVQVGDQVIDRHGVPTAVVGKSTVHHKRCYRVTFTGGQSVICDDDHRWVVRMGPSPGREVVLEARDLQANLRGRRGQRHLRVPLAESMILPDAELPVDPYVLGCWLGDGKHTSGEISKPDDELFDHIAERGYTVGPRHRAAAGKVGGRVVYGLQRTLSDAGLLGHKHVPDVYLRASREQREALLQGLMDTDGTATNHLRRGECSFTSTDKALAHAVHELALSLGQSARIHELSKHGFDRTVTAYDVVFRARGITPFRLSRKAERVPTSGRFRDFRMIESVEEVDTVPTQCIAVDSPTHTYLCTEKMIPTHNTGAQNPDGVRRHAQLARYAWFLARDLDIPLADVDVELHNVHRRTTRVEPVDVAFAERAVRHIDTLADAMEAQAARGWFEGRPSESCAACSVRKTCPALAARPTPEAGE